MNTVTKNHYKLFAFAILMAILSVSATFADDGLAGAEKMSAVKDLVGSWQGANDIGINFLLTFDHSKTYNVTFTIPGVGSAHGHGAWKRTGLNTFESTDVAFVVNPDDGSAALIQKTWARFVIAADNNTADIDVVVELSLPDGTHVDTLTAVSAASRIGVEPFPSVP